MQRDDYITPYYKLSKLRRMRRRLDILLKLYSLMGFLMAILAGGYFVLTLLTVDLSQTQQIALMITGIGIALAVMSRVLMIYRKEREFEEVARLNEYEDLSSFLDTWTRFERTSKAVLAKEGDEFNEHSLRSVISRLYKVGKIEEIDVIALEEALQARNEIVHGERKLSTKAAARITDSLVEIINKIAMTI